MGRSLMDQDFHFVVVLAWLRELQQVADRPRDHEILALQGLLTLGEAPERCGDVTRDAGFLGDHQTLAQSLAPLRGP